MHLSTRQAGLSVGIFLIFFDLFVLLLTLIAKSAAWVDRLYPPLFAGDGMFPVSATMIVVGIVFKFVGGYVAGYVFATIWNWVGKRK